jgi:Protein of unknown function (DUF2950)
MNRIALFAFRFVGGALIALTVPGLAYAVDAKVFDTPDAAAAAMVAALEKGTNAAIVELLGDAHNDELFTDDEAAERENRKRAYDAAKEQMSLREDDADTRTVLIGKDEWPVPFPIVKRGNGWHFDLESGLDELLARRIGQNELAAIASLRAVVDAEEDYRAIDRDGDEVLEYSGKFVSSPGKKDGLYWEVPEGSNDAVSPLLNFVTQQEGYLEGRDEGDPLRGYNFRIITRQGAGAPGGRYDYIINGNMIAGFALLAWPVKYGVSGVNTFAINQQGVLYQVDLGPATEQQAQSIKRFNPGADWSVVND